MGGIEAELLTEDDGRRREVGRIVGVDGAVALMGQPDQTSGEDDPVDLAIPARLDALDQLGRRGIGQVEDGEFRPLAADVEPLGRRVVGGQMRLAQRRADIGRADDVPVSGSIAAIESPSSLMTRPTTEWRLWPRSTGRKARRIAPAWRRSRTDVTMASCGSFRSAATGRSEHAVRNLPRPPGGSRGRTAPCRTGWARVPAARPHARARAGSTSVNVTYSVAYFWCGQDVSGRATGSVDSRRAAAQAGGIAAASRRRAWRGCGRRGASLCGG